VYKALTGEGYFVWYYFYCSVEERCKVLTLLIFFFKQILGIARCLGRGLALPDSCYYLKPQKGSNGDLSSKDLIYQWMCGRDDLISICFIHFWIDLYILCRYIVQMTLDLLAYHCIFVFLMIFYWF